MVNNANEEIEALHHVNPAHTAVVDKRFATEIKQSGSASDSTRSIVLTAYEPNALKYEVNSAEGGVVVFAENYYPGWTSYVDGQEVAHGRADYILRAMNVPAGKHVVEFKFDPQSLHITEAIAHISLALLALGVIAVTVLLRKKNKNSAVCE